jgi:hypothetical protein
MSTDHFFRIGSSHKVCEDYARSSDFFNGARAVVADGCSSSPDTDFGARILSFESMIPAHRTAALFSADNIVGFMDAAESYTPSSVSHRCLDATLLIADFFGDTIRVTAWGDGFFAVRRTDGVIEVRRITFLGEDEQPSGYPLYPSYFGRNPKSRARLEAVRERSPMRQIELWLGDPLNPGKSSDLLVQCTWEDPSYVWEGSPADYDLVAVMSDGADSFYRTAQSTASLRPEPVAALEVITRMLSFKGLRGAFVQRRAGRVLRDLEREHILHSDDFSIAAIHVAKEG